MRSRQVISIALLASSAHAAPSDWIYRCAANSPASREAQAAVEQLGTKITALRPDQDPAPLVAALRELRATPCFLITRDDLQGRFDSALSLATWWNSGGKDWLLSVLRNDPEILLPPDARSTLALDGNPAQPLAPILCRLTDPDCGRETGGWVARAEAALAKSARAQAEAERAHRREQKEGPPADQADCAARAHRTPPEQRYQQWHTCLDTVRSTQDALPLGRVRAPASGWFVVRGRRGHYSFCDEIRAYDLASGAAYVGQSCSGLALLDNGAVDSARTDANRRPQLLTGRLPVDNLREAVWMTLLLSMIQRGIRIQPYHAALPAGVEPRIPRELGTLTGTMAGSAWFSSAQTQLAWVWLNGGRVLASGTLTWPKSSNAAEDHAVALLQIAEAGLQPGCAPTRLPPTPLLSGPAPEVNRRDAPAGVRPVHDKLMDLLDRAMPCAAEHAR